MNQVTKHTTPEPKPPMTLVLTALRSLTEPVGVSSEMSREDLLRWIRRPAIATDKDTLPGFSLARFADNHRAVANVVEVSALVLDDDASGLDVEAVAARWSGFAGVVYSTFSSTPEAPRTRTILFISRPMTAAEHARIWTHVRNLARERGLIPDEQTKDASRFWFVPAVRPDGVFTYAELEGEPLDVDALLAVAPALEPPASSMATACPAPSANRRALAAQLLGGAWPAKGRHAAQLALAGALRRDEWPKDAALDFLCDVCRAAGDEDRPKREKTIEHTWSTGANVTGLVAPDGGDRSGGRVGRASAARSRRGCEGGACRFLDAKNARLALANDTSTSTRLGFEYGAWATEPPPTDFLVDGLIPRGAIAMFYGRADSMKTWLLFSMAIALAKGESWLGAYGVKPVKVGVVDFETGGTNVRRRLYMLRAGTNPNLGAVSFTTLKPSEREFWVALAHEDFDAVIIDSLRRSNPGANENDSAEAILPLELAAEFSELTGCAVLWIHHAKKASGDGWPEFRGSGAIEDQVDCAFAVRKADVTPNRKIVEVRCEKPGDMRMPEPFTVEVNFDDVNRVATVKLAEWAAPNVAEREVTDMEIRAAIKLALADGPIATKEKLKERVTGRRERVYAEIDAMKATGEIVQTDEEGFELDNAERRRARVFKQVEASERWRSVGALARAAYVSTR